MKGRALAFAAMATVVACAVAGPALAGSAILAETCAFVSRIAQWLIGVGYVAGAIGFAFVSMKATATGKFPGSSFIAIGMGMFVLGAVPPIVSYMMDGSFRWTCGT